MSQIEIGSLVTRDPETGYQLAVKLARLAVKITQPDDKAREVLRPQYAFDASGLLAASHVVAVHFATVAAANDYWRSPG